MNYELARLTILIAMGVEDLPEARKMRGRAAWRAFAIEDAYVQMIADANARGLRLVQAGAARADDPQRRLRMHRGQWQMRITLTTDPRKVGEQKIIPLDTTNLSEAQEKRDFLERTFQRIGLLSSRATAGIE